MGVQPEVVDVNRKLTPFFNAQLRRTQSRFFDFSITKLHNFGLLRGNMERLLGLVGILEGGGYEMQLIHIIRISIQPLMILFSVRLFKYLYTLDFIIS